MIHIRINGWCISIIKSRSMRIPVFCLSEKKMRRLGAQISCATTHSDQRFPEHVQISSEK